MIFIDHLKSAQHLEKLMSPLDLAKGLLLETTFKSSEQRSSFKAIMKQTISNYLANDFDVMKNIRACQVW